MLSKVSRHMLLIGSMLVSSAGAAAAQPAPPPPQRQPQGQGDRAVPTDAPPPRYNSRLVIRMLGGESYRYGIHARRATPDLTFRCVASRYQPPGSPGSPEIAR